jgi:hypothetical protein
MSLISASIPNLINGVSQQPPSLKLKTQANLQENARSSVVNGLTKRPCTQMVSVLDNITNPDGAFIHTIRRDENEYYTLIITDTDVLVYDKDGVQRTVNGSTTYLSSLTSPVDQIAATTIADYTFILNKSVVTEMKADLSPDRSKEGLVYVKQGDYTTNYTIKVTKGGTVYSASYETMASTQDTSSAVTTAERTIQTTNIASTLEGSLNGSNIPGLTITNLGSVLWFQSTDTDDFKLEVEDSRGNQHIYAFKGKTPDFKKLPPNGPAGFVIAVVGDNDKGQDDYYVSLQAEEDGNQVWKETIKPNIQTSIDPTTMPHQLISNADGTFTLQEATYKDRKVGDDETNPAPSFIDLPLNDIFFHRNRLGFLADENIILSEAGQFDEFNFFKRTTLTLLDSDIIDAAVSNNKVSILKHAVPFNESLLLFSDLTQFRLTAQDLLTPDTVAVDVTTQFEASLKAKPVGAGRYVFFATSSGKWSGVREYFVDTDASVDDASDITAHIPQYIPGEIRRMEASSNEDMLLVLTEDDPKAIYVYSYYWQGTDKLQSSWSRWSFEGEVLNISFNKSDIDVLIKYSVNSQPVVALERINLSKDNIVNVTGGNYPIHLDRRQVWDSANPLIPLFTADNGVSPIYLTDNMAEVTSDAAQTYVTQGGKVIVGYPYKMRYIFSEQVMKQNNEPMATGRLQLRNMTLVYSDTGRFDVIVRPTARPEKISTFTGKIVGSAANILGSTSIETGFFRFPVLSKASEVEIEINTTSYLPATFQSAEWEGFFAMRSQRL